MKTYFLQLAFILFSATGAIAQGGVAINAAGAPPDSSAVLDVSSLSKGTLLTRMSTAQRNAIVKPAFGLTIFNTDCGVFNYNAGTPANPNWATVTASNVLVAAVTIAANPIGAICAGGNVTFTATAAGGINSPSYQWKVNGNNAGTDSAVFTDSNLHNGDVVSCVLSSNQACVTGSPAASNSITMLVNIVPAITGTTPASFCAGSAVTLSASANLGTINWYSDSTGGSSLSSGASFTVSGLIASAIYYVDASANGCTTASRTPVTATYYPTPPAQPGAITGPANIGSGAVAIYSISPQANTVNYVWTTTLLNLISGQGTDSIMVNSDGFAGEGGNVQVAASNPCGSSAAQTLPVSAGQLFSYTGGQQTFTVPAGASSLSIAVYGAQGGTSGTNIGGTGGYATGTLSVSPGEILYVNTGGQGAVTAGGFNGGGTGYGNGAGGGGASDVRFGGTGLGNRIIIAGGGGGVPNTNWTTTGGTGGGITGGNPTGGAGGTGSGFNGQGGTQNAGGQGETEYEYLGAQEDGSLGQGGHAGEANSGNGGGGGGYYGGGGGDAGGGGGGSGYIGGVNNGAMQNGVQTGNGQVFISWE